MLTRQRVIMHHSLLAAPDRGLEAFAETPDEPGPVRGVTLLLADYLDMGSPKVVTVTLDPGDALNAKDFDCWTDMGEQKEN